ncbi:MAG: thiosulfohydrolase SoxB [Gammaproteobacteria bacterium SG8_31]|jgi:sulfur-oxidizing protein SoxB|nr:MAG: thiosulfohydrolase SoxB [Gammaproteobacteria bacterium SG8_31]
MDRREFLRLLGIGALAGGAAGCASARTGTDGGMHGMYDVPAFGNARLLHFTDCHAQLLPVYFREPNVNIGVSDQTGKLPHLVGEALLEYAGIQPGTAEAHAFTYLNFEAEARRLGKVGGFAHLATLVKKLRAEARGGKALLLDGGDTWQGSGTALWTRGRDMVDACNLLGVDIMTGHWEFTYLEDEVRANVEAFQGEFVAQNVKLTEDAEFYDVPSFNDEGHAFRPYTVNNVAGNRVVVIGQAFPYTPIANPSRFIPNWTFGIRADELQALVNHIHKRYDPEAVILLSHNGMDVDLKLASVTSGINFILGGHTHDGMPVPSIVQNAAGGRTVVTNSGSNGKFLAVLDLDLGLGRVRDFRYRLLPVFSNLLPADPEMQAYIDGVRAPYREQLEEPLAVAESVLYRRGNFNGTFDQLICDGLMAVGDAQIALSPGFRWGTSLLPGDPITMDRLLDQTCITYPETYVREMSGEEIKLILEDVADNLFNPDPFYQQGGDMVRVGGMNYVCDPLEGIGKRISNMTLDSGEPIEAGKKYKVTGWATVGSQAPGAPVWDVVAEYLRSEKTVRIDRLNTPVLKNVDNNPGISDYPS